MDWLNLKLQYCMDQMELAWDLKEFNFSMLGFFALHQGVHYLATYAQGHSKLSFYY